MPSYDTQANGAAGAALAASGASVRPVSGAAVIQFTTQGTFTMLNLLTVQAFAADADALAARVADDNANAKLTAKAILESAKEDAKAVRMVPDGFAARYHDAVTVPLLATLAGMTAARRSVALETVKGEGFGYKDRTDKAKAAWRKQQQFFCTVADAWATLPADIREGLATAYGEPGYITCQRVHDGLKAPEKAARKAEKAEEKAAKDEARAEIRAEEMIATGRVNATQLLTFAEMADAILATLADEARVAALSDDDSLRVLALQEALNARFPVAAPAATKARKAA